MKKLSSFIIIAIAICVAFTAFASCEQPTTRTVTFKYADEIVKTVTVNNGECVAELPSVEVKDNEQFDGWFAGETPFTSQTPVTSDLTLTAKVSPKTPPKPIDPDKYTVTIRIDENTAYDSVECEANAELDLYEYYGLDYEVLEWQDDDGNTYAYDDVYTVTKNATLTAVNPKKSPFVMQMSDDRSYFIVTGLLDSTLVDVTVPTLYYNLPVKEIADNAFTGYNNTLQTLTITDEIEKIGAGAFAGLYGLKELTVPFVGEHKCETADGNGLKGSFVYWFADKVSLDYRPEYVRGYSMYYGGNGEETEENIATAERFLPKSLTKVTVQAGAIANYAFHTVTTIETICLGDEVTTLGTHAFSVNPQNTEMPSANYKLKTVECSENCKITEIGESCFGNQINLEKVCIAPKVKVISDSLFRGFSKLTEITVFENSELETIENNAFFGAPITEIYLPNTLTSIGTHAFNSCAELTEVDIPKNAVNLGSGIFRGCEKLTKATFDPQSRLTEIPAYMFSGCISLATVKLPASIVRFNEESFNNCRSITKLDDEEIGFELINVTYIGDRALASTGFRYVDISADISYIGGGAFSGCANLEGVYFDDTSENCKLTEIRSYAFDCCYKLASIGLPDSVTKLGERAFSYTGLRSIVLPANLEIIDNRAFYVFLPEQSSLADITDFGQLQSLKSIGDSAFENNGLLTFESFPDSLTHIGDMAFRESGISGTITLNPATLAEIGAYAFANCKNVTLNIIGKSDEVPAKWQNGWAGAGETATRTFFTLDDHREIVTINDFECYLEDNVYYVTKYVGNASEVVLQDTFNEVPVSYGSAVFANNQTLTSLTFAENMTEIPREFCSDCKSLTTVVIPESAQITSIGDYAFRHCKLTSFTLSDASELTRVGNYAFYGNYQITRITLTNNSKINYVGDYAFKTWAGATGTELIKLDLDLTNAEYIGAYAFESNSSVIAEYTVTSALKHLGESAFGGCKNIKLTLKDGFTTTRFENKVFEQITLIWENASFEGVEYIGNNAFATKNSSLANTKITLPSCVTYIGQSAFSGAGLLGATIDCNSELEIGDYAFAYSAREFNLVIKGAPQKIGMIICGHTNRAHIYFTETISKSAKYVFTLGESDCVINNMFYWYAEDSDRAIDVPYFGKGQWQADENGEPIHPNDGHEESHS